MSFVSRSGNSLVSRCTLSLVSRSTGARAALGPLAAAVLLIVMNTGAHAAYQTYSVGLAAVYTILVLSVGLLAGWAGIWSVGHPAFFASARTSPRTAAHTAGRWNHRARVR